MHLPMREIFGYMSTAEHLHDTRLYVIRGGKDNANIGVLPAVAETTLAEQHEASKVVPLRPLPITETATRVPPPMPVRPMDYEPGGEDVYFGKLIPLLEQWEASGTDQLPQLGDMPFIPEELQTDAHRKYEEELAAFHDYRLGEVFRRAQGKDYPPPFWGNIIVADFTT